MTIAGIWIKTRMWQLQSKEFLETVAHDCLDVPVRYVRTGKNDEEIRLHRRVLYRNDFRFDHASINPCSI